MKISVGALIILVMFKSEFSQFESLASTLLFLIYVEVKRD